MRTLVALVVAAVLHTGSAQAAQARGDDLAPTPIEQALIDHACRAGTPTAPSSDEPYQTCLTEELLTLRANFGRDLKRLTGADRRKVDARCTPLQATRGHDAYISCLGRELQTLLGRRGGGAVRTAVVPPVLETRQPPVTPNVALSEAPAEITDVREDPTSPAWTERMWMAGPVVVSALALLAWRRIGRVRQTIGNCRQCGGPQPTPGDLCAECRREAAAVRRTMSDGALAVHAPAAGALGDRGSVSGAALPHAAVATPDDLARAERVRVEEEARARAEAERAEEARSAEEAARREEAKRLEAKRRREEEIFQLSTDADAPADVFNPYLVLGVSRGATMDEIEAAYAALRQKYAPDQVEHLGAELRDHFKSKALAADRAYQLLAQVVTAAQAL